MKVKLIAYGVAKDILQGSELKMEVEEDTSIASLKSSLISQFPHFSELRSLRFAINEDYQDDSYCLQPNDEVVIIPPVSGG